MNLRFPKLMGAIDAFSKIDGCNCTPCTPLAAPLFCNQTLQFGPNQLLANYIYMIWSCNHYFNLYVCSFFRSCVSSSRSQNPTNKCCCICFSCDKNVFRFSPMLGVPKALGAAPRGQPDTSSNQKSLLIKYVRYASLYESVVQRELCNIRS